MRTKSRAKQGRARSSAPASPSQAPRRPARRPVASLGSAPARARRRPAASAAPAGALALADLSVLASIESQVSEEERIESSKYVPGRPTRLFEEERFVFPESYGRSRVRLLVKDPEWLFAFWDVDARALEDLRARHGERVVALARLSLRVSDPAQGGSQLILLPAGARSWYVRTDAERRAYRAELGMTLPSGEFRPLATSNTVIVPRRGPSPEPARATLSWRQAGALPVATPQAAAAREAASVPASGPWQPSEPLSAPDQPPSPVREEGAGRRAAAGPGGASDVLGPRPPGGPEAPGGASDVHNRH